VFPVALSGTARLVRSSDHSFSRVGRLCVRLARIQANSCERAGR
jgi:hypothetical protein